MKNKNEITIDTPYWSAGTRYKWTEEFKDRAGFGIHIDMIRTYETILIKSGQFIYKIDKPEIKRLIEKYQPYMTMGGARLVVVPRQACHIIQEPML